MDARVGCRMRRGHRHAAFLSASRARLDRPRRVELVRRAPPTACLATAPLALHEPVHCRAAPSVATPIIILPPALQHLELHTWLSGQSRWLSALQWPAHPALSNLRRNGPRTTDVLRRRSWKAHPRRTTQ